jgi:hypothetical protein
MNEQTLSNTLTAAGWSFHNDGVTLALVIDGKRRQVFVPIRNLWVEFGREFQAVGCPLQGVGDFSSVGFWKSLTRAVKRVARKASRVVKSSVRRVSRVAARTWKKVVKPAMAIAKAVVNNPIVRHGIKAAALAFPILAPVALGVEAAAQALKFVDDGRRAAERVYNAARTGMRVLQGDRMAMARALGIQRNMARVVGLARQGNPAALRQISAFRQLAA